MMDETHIEELRRWLNSNRKSFRTIAAETGLTIYLLRQFADGRVQAPRTENWIVLETYYRKITNVDSR